MKNHIFDLVGSIFLKLILITYVGLFLGCSLKTKHDNITFIIPNYPDPNLEMIRDGLPPPPPIIKIYYMPSNFIIDTNGNVYYYQQKLKPPIICGTGFDWNTPPSFISLDPQDIIEVPIKNIEEFIELNINSVEINEKACAIASVKDTIASEGLAKILSVFKKKNNSIKWQFRKTTHEENIVLKFKKSKEKYYDPKEIKWDSTNIVF